MYDRVVFALWSICLKHDVFVKNFVLLKFAIWTDISKLLSSYTLGQRTWEDVTELEKKLITDTGGRYKDYLVRLCFSYQF